MKIGNSSNNLIKSNNIENYINNIFDDYYEFYKNNKKELNELDKNNLKNIITNFLIIQLKNDKNKKFIIPEYINIPNSNDFIISFINDINYFYDILKKENNQNIIYQNNNKYEEIVNKFFDDTEKYINDFKKTFKYRTNFMTINNIILENFIVHPKMLNYFYYLYDNINNNFSYKENISFNEDNFLNNNLIRSFKLFIIYKVFNQLINNLNNSNFKFEIPKYIEYIFINKNNKKIDFEIFNNIKLFINFLNLNIDNIKKRNLKYLVIEYYSNNSNIFNILLNYLLFNNFSFILKNKYYLTNIGLINNI